MYKRVLGYIMICIGLLCFLSVGGGSMRYRNRSVSFGYSINESILIILLYIITPVIGFFLIKFGLKIIKKNEK